MVSTTISTAFCQRLRFCAGSKVSVKRRVTSQALKPMTAMSAQVKTMVALSLTKPCCQKISSSGLRCMADLLLRARPDRLPQQSRHYEARRAEAQHRREQPVTVAT